MNHRHFRSRTAALLDSTDWNSTPLGPVEGWPRCLAGYVAMVMATPAPAIIFWGPELTQIYNDGYAEIMGPRHPRFFGAPYRDCWPDTYPLIYPWMRRVLDHGEIVEVERELIPLTRLGFDEDAYFTFTFTPLLDDEGRIAGILQPVFEVTDSVLAERRAGVLRQLATLAAEGDPLVRAIDILAAAEGDITAVMVCEEETPSHLRVVASVPPSRFNEADLKCLALLENAEPGFVDLPVGRAFVCRLWAEQEPDRRRLLVVLPNGRLRESPAYAQFLEMVAHDLSSVLQRARAAQAERRQREYLDRLFMQAPAGIAVLRGPEHVYELVNPMYRSLIGGRDVLGLPLDKALPELQGQHFKQTLERVYETGRPYVGLAEPAFLVRGPGAEPEGVYLNYVYQPLQDAAGVGEGILVFCYEVTEQVLARQHTEKLADALRQEHQRKDEFLAMLAHELRNPLAPVKSAADLMMLKPDDLGVAARASRIISRQVKHLSELIDDLLDVARVTRGLITLERQCEDLGAVVKDAVEQVRPLAETRSHQLVLELPAQPLYVMGDRKRLVQIIANLLNNAAKYMPDGGHIDVRLHQIGQQAVLTVADTGIGIEAALLPRVFDLFVQGERSSARSAGGLGIGLALARSLVEMQGGRIEAHSDGPGLGSRFVVRLPLLDVGTLASASDKAEPRTMPRGRGQRILVVDDNRDAANMLALQLQASGYQTVVRHDGRSALAEALGEPYFACLVDVGLPDLSGLEVASRLKAGLPTAPLLVAISGYGQEADVRLAREAGFDHYIVKPADAAVLGNLLREHADRVSANPSS